MASHPNRRRRKETILLGEEAIKHKSMYSAQPSPTKIREMFRRPSPIPSIHPFNLLISLPQCQYKNLWQSNLPTSSSLSIFCAILFSCIYSKCSINHICIKEVLCSICYEMISPILRNPYWHFRLMPLFTQSISSMSLMSCVETAMWAGIKAPQMKSNAMASTCLCSQCIMQLFSKILFFHYR